MKLTGPGREAAVISWEAPADSTADRLPGTLTLAMRPSGTAPGRVRAILVQPVTNPADAGDDVPLYCVPFADFRLEMN
jgi:hypothetical protein